MNTNLTETVNVQEIENKISEVAKNTNPDINIVQIKGHIDDHANQLSKYKQDLEKVNQVITALVVALLIAFITVLITAYASYPDRYALYIEQLRQLESDRYDLLNKKIEDLESAGNLEKQRK